jgi:competence protein ComEC
MAKYISNHLFIFLICLVLIASCCVCGILAVDKIGKGSVKEIIPATSPAGETISPNLPIFTDTTPHIETNKPGITSFVEIATPSAIPSKEVLSPTASITLSRENTPIIQPATPSQTIEAEIKPSTKRLVVHFINVGQGDSILIESPSSMTMLIDGGSADTGVVAYLREQGVKRIDLMVATHPHEDHIGGLTQVLEAMPVSKVVTSGETDTTSAYEHFLDAILKSRAEYSEARRGATLTLGELTFSVMNPSEILEDDPNENSLVLRMTYGKTTFLFMGDAGKISESNMMALSLPLNANILKVGHHGSCMATSAAFVQAVHPEVGIYSAGVNNSFGFPCAATIKALIQYGVLVLGTDVDGSIIVKATEDGYTITDATGKVFKR